MYFHSLYFDLFFTCIRFQGFTFGLDSLSVHYFYIYYYYFNITFVYYFHCVILFLMLVMLLLFEYLPFHIFIFPVAVWFLNYLKIHWFFCFLFSFFLFFAFFLEDSFSRPFFQKSIYSFPSIVSNFLFHFYLHALFSYFIFLFLFSRLNVYHYTLSFFLLCLL